MRLDEVRYEPLKAEGARTFPAKLAKRHAQRHAYVPPEALRRGVLQLSGNAGGGPRRIIEKHSSVDKPQLRQIPLRRRQTAAKQHGTQHGRVQADRR
jgi:hypothetical protein